jgi:hypothetical protein
LLAPLPLFTPPLTSILQACAFAELSKVAEADFCRSALQCEGYSRGLRGEVHRYAREEAQQTQYKEWVKSKTFNSKLDTHLARARRARHSGSAVCCLKTP